MSEKELKIRLWQKKLDPFVIFAAFLVIPVVIIESLNAPGWLLLIAQIANWISWAIFATELVVMTYLGGLFWLRKNWIIALITFITIPLAPPGFAIARFLRFARLLRIIPAFQSAQRIFSLQGVAYSAVIAASMIIMGGLIFVQLEPEQKLSLMDGIWWAVTTVTTVGYGDISPTTSMGKILAVFLMFIGIGFVAIITGFIAERFVAKMSSEQQKNNNDAQILEELALLRQEVQSLREELSIKSEASSHNEDSKKSD